MTDFEPVDHSAVQLIEEIQNRLCTNTSAFVEELVKANEQKDSFQTVLLALTYAFALEVYALKNNTVPVVLQA